MSLSTKENNIVKYKTMDNKKVKCNRCGSTVLKSSFTRHNSTAKCLAGKSGDLQVRKTARHQQMRTNTSNARTKLIKEIGIEKVREAERLKKRKQREKNKTKQKQSPPENEHDEALVEIKEAKAQVEEIKDKEKRLKLIEVINDARNQIATGKKTLPETKKIIKTTIQKINEDSEGKENCNTLVDRLDSKNLKNPNAHHKIERNTLEGYIHAIERVYKGMSGETFDCSDFTWLNNTDAVIEYVENMKTADGTKRNYFNAIYSILRRLEGYSHLTTEYNKAKTRYGDIVDDERGKNRLSDKEAKNILPWTTLVNYNDKSWNEEARLLFKLYTAMPPRRVKDYALLKYIKGKSIPKVKQMDKSYNYIVVNGNGNPIALVINNFKTRKTYGTYTVDLTIPDVKPHFRFSEIKKAIKNFAKATGVKSGDIVFPNTQGEPYRKDFTAKWIHFLFKGTGKKIGVNLLRHSFISHFLDKNPNVNQNTVKKIAYTMSHKPDTFRSYRKLDAPVEYESDTDDDE